MRCSGCLHLTAGSIPMGLPACARKERDGIASTFEAEEDKDMRGLNTQKSGDSWRSLSVQILTCQWALKSPGGKWGGVLWTLKMQPLFQESGRPRGQQSVILRDSCPFPSASCLKSDDRNDGIRWAADIWNNMLIRNLRYPLLHRAQDTWNPTC